MLLAVVFFGLFVWFSVCALAAILVSYIGLHLLVVLGPLFILATLFSLTRDLFAKWLGYCLSMALVFALVGGVLGITQTLTSQYFQDFQDSASKLDFYLIFAPAVIIALLARFFVEIPSLASSIAGGLALSMGPGAAAISAAAAPMKAALQRTVGERMNAKRTVRHYNKVSQERIKARNKGLPSKS